MPVSASALPKPSPSSPRQQTTKLAAAPDAHAPISQLPMFQSCVPARPREHADNSHAHRTRSPPSSVDRTVQPPAVPSAAAPALPLPSEPYPASRQEPALPLHPPLS